MSYDNYQSPYGFGLMTDAVIDAIATRHNMTAQQMADALDDLPEGDRETLSSWVEDKWWSQEMLRAIDRLEQLFNHFIELPESSQ
jgi:hypothetical protein